jgi:uncharacterized protein (TIGR03435 family)
MSTHLAPAVKFPRKTLFLTAVWIALVCPMLLGQSSTVSGASSSPASNTTGSPAPSFDVATIKPHAGMLSMVGVMNTPEGLNGSAATVSMLLVSAYGLRSEDQVSGGPDWVRSNRFDVQAKVGAADIAEMDKLSPAEKTARRQPMLQTLLAERFKLKTHSATRQVPVYELVVAKGGSKLKDAAIDSNEHLQMGKDGKTLTGYLRFLKDTSIAQGYSMTSLAGLLSQPFAGLGRPVLDKTELTSTYDFTLNWSVYSAGVRVTNGAASSSPSDDATSIFEALREIGLRLQPSTGPVESVVIDHVERPTED